MVQPNIAQATWRKQCPKDGRVISNFDRNELPQQMHDSNAAPNMEPSSQHPPVFVRDQSQTATFRALTTYARTEQRSM